jgi:regulator of protease activity HflC (stomatin/prohibitin superfamily)
LGQSRVADEPPVAGETDVELSIAIAALVVLVAIVLFAGIKTVPQSYEWTVERFGRYIKTLRPGLNLIVPFIDRIGKKLAMAERLLEIPQQQAITKDNAQVTVDGVVFYQVLDAPRAAYEVVHLDGAITNLALTNIRTVVGSMDLDEVLSKRDDINVRLLHTIDDATGPWGIKVTRVEIKELSPPADLVESMARQMKAEREKRAAILSAEGFKQGEILKAEGEKQAQILAAEARLEAAKRDAEARERQAQAEATATQLVSKAIAEGELQAINYFVAQRYLQAFEKLASAPNQKLIIVPAELSGIVGALGGIVELTRGLQAGPRGGSDGGTRPPGPWETPRP